MAIKPEGEDCFLQGRGACAVFAADKEEDTGC